MELRHLRYFVAAAEELNFRRAAERLHIATPALSVQMQKLQEEIGADLFARAGRGIRLTEAGRIFLDQARRTIGEANRGVSLARQAASGEIGDLSIGHNGPAELLIIPHVAPAFKRKRPEVHLNFHSHRTPQQIERLRRGELDIAFVWQPVPQQDFDVHDLMQVPLVAALPANHRLARMKSLSIRDLANEPLMLFSRMQDLDSFNQIEQLFLQTGTPMNIVYEFDNLLSIVNFVAMGSGVSILPDYSRRILGEVVYRPFSAPNIVKTLAIAKNKTSDALANQFFDFTLEQLGLQKPPAAAKARRRRP